MGYFIGSMEEVITTARDLYYAPERPDKPVRLLGVAISNLGSLARQLNFWDGNSEKEQRLQEAIDILRSQYGKNVLHRGNPLNNK